MSEGERAWIGKRGRWLEERERWLGERGRCSRKGGARFIKVKVVEEVKVVRKLAKMRRA